MGAMWHATWDSRRGVLAAEESTIMEGHGLHMWRGSELCETARTTSNLTRDGEILWPISPSASSLQQPSVGSGFCITSRTEPSHCNYQIAQHERHQSRYLA